MRKKRITTKLCFIVSMALLLSGCGSSNTKTTEPENFQTNAVEKTTASIETTANTEPATKATQVQAETAARPTSAEDTTTKEDPGNKQTEPVPTTQAKPSAAFPDKAAADLVNSDFFGVWYGENGEEMVISEEMVCMFKDHRGNFESYWAWMPYDGSFDLIMRVDDEWHAKYMGDGVLKGKFEVSKKELTLYYEKPEVAYKDLPAIPNHPTVFSPVTATLRKEYEVTILGSELFYDDDDQQAIRFYFLVTNKSGEKEVLSSYIGVRLSRGNASLTQYDDDYSAEARRFRRVYTYNNGTILAAAEFRCDWDSSEPVTFQVRHYILSAAEMHNALDKLDPNETYSINVEFKTTELPAMPSGGLDQYR